MSFTISDILSRNLFNGTKLVAGELGLTNQVNWVNLMEILDSPDSLKENELLITTAYDLDNYEKYKNIIYRLKDRGIAGMVIQLGYYITTIPDYIIQSANENNFPILDMPSHFSFSDILHTMINEINNEMNKKNKSIIDYDYFYPSIKNKLLASNQLNLENPNPSYLFAICLSEPTKINNDVLISSLNQIQSMLIASANSIVYDVSDHFQAIYCLTLRDHINIHALAYDIQIQLTFLSEQEGGNFYISIDSLYSLDQLHLAFEHTTNSISLLHDISAKRGVCTYENFTFIKLFGHLYHDNASFVLENQALQILLVKDRTNKTNYVHTLRTFLAENCNITHTAERLFIHRHTMMNRIQTITDLCNINFNDYYTRIYLSMALLMHDFFAA